MAEKCRISCDFPSFLMVITGFFVILHPYNSKPLNMDKFIITTTPTIEGHPIKAYLGAINVNVVIGTNFFSDFAASFTDVFGGSSGTYQRKMDAMYESAQKELEKKARRLGCNAIVGFKTDFDEISGKGKSMFMLSATGTACKIENSSDTLETDEVVNFVDSARLKQELDKDELMAKLAKVSHLSSITEDDWQYMTDHPSKDAVKIILEKYYSGMTSEDSYYRNSTTEHKTKSETLLNLLDYNEASDIVYEIYGGLSDEANYGGEANYHYIGNFIRSCSLFNPSATKALISSSPAKAADILDCDKPFYDSEDLRLMKEILSMFNSLPDVGQISVGKNGMFSKEKELFVCQHGHKNEKDSEFCSSCGENIKGLNRNHLKKIEQFKVRVETLERLMGKC